MFQALSIAWAKATGALQREEAQDGFEYLLVVGGVSVAIVLAMAAVPGLIPAVVSGVCGAIDTAIPGPALTCP